LRTRFNAHSLLPAAIALLLSVGIAQVCGAQEAVKAPPLELELKADQQSYDNQLERFVATGNVVVLLAGGRLQADRLEYDSDSRVIWARGSVRFQRGNQYIQASEIRYNLVQGEGELENVYGVVDLLTNQLDLNPDAPLQGTPAAAVAEQKQRRELQLNPPKPGVQVSPASVAPLPPPEGMACPPNLPPLVTRHPHPWAITAWGGQMTDATFGETFTLSGSPRPEYLGGIGFNRKLLDADPFDIELDGNLFFHTGDRSSNLRFRKGVPEDQSKLAFFNNQQFWELTFGIGLRWWIQPWLSLGVVEGVSLNSALSNYEKVSWLNSSQFLNYLAVELGLELSPQWSMVGRIHHRSGAYGVYSGVYEGSNGYLLGARYRFGSSAPKRPQVENPPPLGCPDPDRASRQPSLPLDEQLEAVAFDGPSAQEPPVVLPPRAPSALTPSQQLAQRRAAIADLDQRVRDVQPRLGLTLDQRFGKNDLNALTGTETAYGQATPAQLQQLQTTKNQKLISGSVTHWRFQAPRVQLTPEGWTAPRASFSNDPFTPAQVWVDMESVKSKQEIDGTTVIESSRNRLLLENKVPVPLPSTFRIKPKQEQEVENRWALKNDKLDRDGLFVQYALPEVRLGGATVFSLRPQFMIERAFRGTTSAYPAPGASAGSGNVTQNNTIGDLFGALALLEGSFGTGKFYVRTDVSSFSEQNLSNATRVVGELIEPVKLPVLGTPLARVFGAYRFRIWNGSLGEQDIYSAYGASLEKQSSLPTIGKLSSSYFWRAGVGNYQSNDFVSGTSESNNFADLWRANFYGAIRANLPLWIGKALPLTSEGAYRYSGTAIIPGLSLNFVPFVSLSAYGGGQSQNLVGISGGPVITLGHFNRTMFDFTRLSLFGSLAAKSGESPFAFDRYVDTATLGIGLTQQLIGPLVFDGAVSYNVAGNSGYYGDVTNSYVELRWQRRAYEVGLFYSPYTGIGGIRMKLNDFGFRGPGLPFVPYEPSTGVVLGP
jgi:lipopolysaccharide export system protein LptA